jgi:hypothetical protein
MSHPHMTIFPPATRRIVLRGLLAWAGVSHLPGAAFAAEDAVARKFDFLSQNGNSNCSQAFLDSIPSLPHEARLQGS